jgi:hypothetical protein
MESITEQIVGRLEIGKKRYGHGVIVDSDTREWGTPKNSWIDMAVEEFLDAIIYVIADYIRQERERQKVDEREHHEPDDNKLIMHILKNHEKIESPKHRMLVWNLINILFASSQF